MLPKSKTRLAVQRERARLGMCNLRQRRRVEELPEQRETRLAAERESKKRRRIEESQEQRENRLAASRDNARLGMCNLRQRRCVEELPEQRETRLAVKRESEKRRRVEESQEQRENRLAADRESKKRKRAEESQEQPENYRMAFRYSPVDDYSRCVQIGTMSKMCPYCKALKFNCETMGMCCASGKVKLPLLAAPPEPVKTLPTGTTSESKRFFYQTSENITHVSK